jgi:excisionase family DNA binding protein
MPAPSPLVYSCEEAAVLLCVSKASVYGAIARKELPSFRLGRRVLIPRAGLEALLNPDRTEET